MGVAADGTDGSRPRHRAFPRVGSRALGDVPVPGSRGGRDARPGPSGHADGDDGEVAARARPPGRRLPGRRQPGGSDKITALPRRVP
jgi:hypothetical protein